jgi:drug/metabolite transporter (DMT)-like permease
MLSYLGHSCFIFSSTGLILVNKNLMSTYRFEFPAILTCYQSFLTSIVFFLFRSFNLLEIPSPIPTFFQWIFGVLNGLSSIAIASSLWFNSITFFELSQSFAIPCILIHRLLFLGQSVPRNVLWPLCFLFGGVFLFTVNDTHLNSIGSLFAIAAAILNAVCQIQTVTLSRQYSLNSVQIDSALSFPRFVAVFVAAVSIESRSITAHELQSQELILILSTGVIIAVIDCLSVWMVGSLSSIALILRDHVQKVAVICCGTLLFPSGEIGVEKKIWQWIAIVVSIGGSVVYSLEDKKNQEIENRAMVAFREEEEQIEAPVALIVPGIEFEKQEIENDD